MNKKRYWLRGGVAGLILAIGYAVYNFHDPCIFSDLVNTGGVCEISMFENLTVITLNSIGYSLMSFPLGVLSGWFYGKIKSRYQ